MNDDNRMKNLFWFSDLKFILMKHGITNTDELADLMEDIYNITQKTFVKEEG